MAADASVRSLVGQLLEQALARRLVLAPAPKLGPVADAPGAHVVEVDLDDELRSQPAPLELAPLGPAARLAASPIAGLVRGEETDEPALLGRLQPRAVTDDAQLAVVVQAEDEGADGVGLLPGAPADDHAVDRAHAFDLHHRLA